jgi:Resolvase, N terminal domain
MVFRKPAAEVKKNRVRSIASGMHCHIGHEESAMLKHARKPVALYLRVITSEQTTRNQRRQLEAVAKRNGWEVVAVFEDAGISGAKGHDQRPGFAISLELFGGSRWLSRGVGVGWTGSDDRRHFLGR